MARGVAFGYDEVGTGAQRMADQGFGGRVVPLGACRHLDAVLAEAARYGLEALERSVAALDLIFAEALTTRFQRVHQHGLGERMEEFEGRARGARQLRGLAHGGHGACGRILDGDEDALQRFHGHVLRQARDGHRVCSTPARGIGRIT
jgi:hypothetical protein